MTANAALFPNGDFEKGAAGWKLPDGLWSVIDGAGVKGSKAIVVDIPPGSNLNYVVSEMFPVEPGTVYRFEVSMKNDSFKCRYGHIGASFEALDSGFHEVGGCGGTLQDDSYEPDGAASGPGIIARNRKMFMDSMEIVRKAMRLR